MTLPADNAETSKSLTFLNAAALLEAPQNAQPAPPDEKVNKVLCKHYRFDESAYALQNREGVKVTGDLYLAADDNHLVRLIIEGLDPQMADDKKGITADDHFRLEYNVLSVNQPVEITVPAECEEQAGGAELASYPILDDAYHILDQGATLTYQTKAALDQVLAFYQKTLGEQGWTYDAEGTQKGEAGAIWFFRRGEEGLQVMAGGKGGQTMVSLTEDKTVEDKPVEAESLPHTPDAFDVLSLSNAEIYKTHAAAEDILAFYQKALAAQGWKFDPEATLTNESGTAWFFKQEKETIRVLTAPEENNIVVTVQRVYE